MVEEADANSRPTTNLYSWSASKFAESVTRDVSELVVATTIPSPVCFDGGTDNVDRPRVTSYSEVVIF
jgi:hypothetical protein